MDKKQIMCYAMPERPWSRGCGKEETDYNISHGETTIKMFRNQLKSYLVHSFLQL